MTHSGLRLAFAGTPKLAATILQALLDDASHTITRVYTQPDRIAGRGRKLAASSVKHLAELQHLPVTQPLSGTRIDPDNELVNVDVLIVAAFGIILPAEILQRPIHGCINVHTSLLPRWRGAAPIIRAIQAGDKETGITIMQMDPGLDTGDILLQRTCQIFPYDTAGSLQDRLADLAAETLLQALDNLARGKISPQKQDDMLATYADKVSKPEAKIDWAVSAVQIERNVRAFNPAPVAYTRLHGVDMRIWEAMILPDVDHNNGPGHVIACHPDGIDVTTGAGILRIKSLQLPGKKVISARDFYNSHPEFI